MMDVAAAPSMGRRLAHHAGSSRRSPSWWSPRWPRRPRSPVRGPRPTTAGRRPSRTRPSTRPGTGRSTRASSSSSRPSRRRTVTLRARSPAVEYRRAVDLGFLGEFQAGAFATIAVPAFERNGTVLNPIGGFDNRELAGIVVERFRSLRVGDPVEERNVTTLGCEARVTTFEGSAEVEGTSIDVFVDVTAVRSGDDFVVVVGVQPRLLPDERSNVGALFGAVEHPGEPRCGRVTEDFSAPPAVEPVWSRP